jgi:hypothetical protein
VISKNFRTKLVEFNESYANRGGAQGMPTMWGRPKLGPAEQGDARADFFRRMGVPSFLDDGTTPTRQVVGV